MVKANSSKAPASGARNFIFSWGPVLVWMAAIFYASSQNTWTLVQGPPSAQALRKSAHVWEYSALALLVGRALLATWSARGAILSRPLMLNMWRVGVLISSLYAASDEIHQAFVPRREFHVTDIAIDTLSATAALGIWYILYIRRRNA